MLALLMILTAFGCTEKKKKKKKVIVEEVVIVKPSDDDDDYNNETPSDTDDTDEPQDEPEEEEKGLPERPLPEAAEVEGGYFEWKEKADALWNKIGTMADKCDINILKKLGY